MLTAKDVAKFVEKELHTIDNPKVVEKIRPFLVTPYCVDREWDYGEPGDTYPCWTVLEHPPSELSIVYCEQGFGPKHPWGLVWTEGRDSGIGMDSGWYATLEQVCVEEILYDEEEVR